MLGKRKFITWQCQFDPLQSIIHTTICFGVDSLEIILIASFAMIMVQKECLNFIMALCVWMLCGKNSIS